MRRALLVVIIAVTLSVAGALGWAGLPLQTDRTESARTVDAPALTTSGSADITTTIAGLQAHLRAQPADAQSWATLGEAYVEQARLTGDPSYYDKAAKVLRQSLREQPDDNASALAGQAALAAARHQFSRALATTGKALRINPYHPVALAIRVDALTELGRYHDQLRALDRADRRQPGLPIFTRYAYAFELRGDLDRARALLRRTLSPVSPPADRAFVLTILADIDRRAGDLPAAERHLRAALDADPDYVQAWVGRARLAVAKGRLEQAERWWLKVTSRLPLPEYVVELGELYLATGQPRLARKQFAVVRTVQELFRRSGVHTDLELALFAADHGDAAVAVRAAQSEFARRQSVHAADALAWALHAGGRSEQALPHARAATRLGTPEARLWLHRGIIEAATGHPVDARRHLQRGLRTDPGASPWLADHARRALAEIAGGDR
ncbi:MAG TPA: tetratricopeptide repeat protein [Nocardioidaceae bacterium]|nr:tetratricopeptide repeat protein [Nocardioidaceae bacterium]